MIEDADAGNGLLRLHAIRNLPAEIILSDMLNVGLLKDLQKEIALELISNAQRYAPQALFGHIMEQLPGKFNTTSAKQWARDDIK
ncbi:hypothetical protein [Chitinophaga sp.]|uniref:hypothetical protein n=1 Tax=Chitinophaga sp. TaxID=1869181 RepID=UPI002F933040